MNGQRAKAWASKAWAVVLAGGEGSRLHGLTRNSEGVAVPKQFCSLQGGPTLIQESLQRAASIAPLQRICAVVAAHHRPWWRQMLSYLPEQNVIVQSHNLGTAHGMLLPLLQIESQDPDAVVVFMPADHYISDEETLTGSLRQAAALAAIDRESIYLLGAEPDQPDTELGYIVPGSRSKSEPSPVLRFVEKPTEAGARMLLEQGALWNVFIVAASVRAFLTLFESSSLAAVMPQTRGRRPPEIDAMHRKLSSVDFSRDVLQGNEAMLRVLPVPYCGWTDLGTPPRIATTLQRLQELRVGPAPQRSPSGHLNLADQYAWVEQNPGSEGRFGRVNLHA
jgi:mannose-1-phosphate guanylyltransferase